MRKWFFRSLTMLGGIFLTSALMFGLMVANPEGSLLFNAATGVITTLLCSSPLVMLVSIVTGIATLIDTFSGKNQKSKRKNDEFDLGFDEDARLQDIMQRLTPQQQVFLENQLRNARLGVGTDGELMSMNELLDEYDDNSDDIDSWLKQ